MLFFEYGQSGHDKLTVVLRDVGISKQMKQAIPSFLGLAGLLLALTPAIAEAGSGMVPVAGGPDVHLFKLHSAPVELGGKIRIGFGLAGFRKDAADAFVADLYNPTSLNYHEWISTATFGQYFGASDSDVKAISDYLVSEGFTDINVGAGKSFITASGTFQEAQHAFGTSFANYVRPDELVAHGDPAMFYGPRTTIKLPADLAPKVAGAFGFTDLSLSHPSALKLAKAKRSGSGFTPSQLATAYDSSFESLNRGQNLKIAVYSPTKRYANDATLFATKMGIPQDFTITDVPIDGGSSSTQGLLEASIDQETIIGQAYKSHIYLVEPPTTETGKIDAYDWMGKNKIPVVTSSWTNKESSLISANEQSYATQFENVCETLAAAGTTIFNDTGDYAAFGGSGAETVGMECCCPYVTAVGGTSLLVNTDEAWKSESLWTYNGIRSDPLGGAGGISKMFKRPTWQVGYGVSNSYSDGYREIPDVSANASNATPYAAVVDGKTNVLAYGTSLATPLWAANFLLMLESYSTTQGKTVLLGNINPILYQLGNEFENPNVDLALNYLFHDITVGNNGLYPTTVGYDLCSGWGSADFGKLLEDYGAAERFNGYSPDFKPYTFTGWTHPIMFHATATNVAEPVSFVHGTKYYIAASSSNSGTADGPSAPYSITVDGTPIVTTHIFYAEKPKTAYSYLNVGTVTFTKGTHTIVFTVNTGSSVYEADKSNNTYTRTITVD